MKKSFIITFILACISAIVGAGFASGREITSFFGNLGYWAIPFFFVVFLLFFWCFYMFSKIGKMIRPSSISDMTKTMFGRAYIFVDFAFVICTFITLASMLAGTDSIGSLVFKENYNFCYISIITAMLAVVVVSVGLKYIYKTNNILLPVILVSIVVVSVAFLVSPQRETVSQTYINFNLFTAIITSILYVSMNTFTNIFMIAKSSQYLEKRKITIACLITSSAIFCLIMLIFCAIMKGGDSIFLSDMPLISIAFGLGDFWGIFYAFVLWLAIFTTICIASFTLQTWLNNYIKNKFVCAVVVLTLGFLFSRFGFSTIVSVFYPIEGIFGAVFIVLSTLFYFRNKSRYEQNSYMVVRDIKLNNTFQSYDFNLQSKFQKEPKVLTYQNEENDRRMENFVSAKEQHKSDIGAVALADQIGYDGEIKIGDEIIDDKNVKILNAKNGIVIPKTTIQKAKTKRASAKKIDEKNAKTTQKISKKEISKPNDNPRMVKSLKVEKKNGKVTRTKTNFKN